ncbi:RNA-binding S4 domain-containing protein [Vibrio hippocampi]|uniref:Urease n=1 Tax=Vibrio hippocampi TaxID=654686 RepID=A0ABM8ZMY7_9VIBR|nr:RNA-binding S4 domain-containing protein [Vibrio hippocampi]CAH0529902.1 hypothetical protein VHP8226_03656 [Vibrio hippocampi]
MNQDAFEDYSEPEEIEIEAIGIEVSSQPIELYKLFKVANLVGGGGEAKHFIAEGYVAVNGELETRKRRKMYDGDFFEFNQEYYVMVCDEPPMEERPEVADVEKTAPQQNKAPENKAPANKASKNKSSGRDKKAKQSQKQNSPSQRKSSGSKDPNSGRGSIDFF